MSAAIVQKHIGQHLGTHAKGVTYMDHQSVRSIGFIGCKDWKPCGMVLNGKNEGGKGGYYDRHLLVLQDDEFIQTVQAEANGAEITYIGFFTNKKRYVSHGHGGSGGSKLTLKNIRLISMGGSRKDDKLCNLEFKYVQNYKLPDQLPATEEGKAVLDMFPAGTTFQTTTSSELSVLSSEVEMLNKQFTAERTVSAESADATFSASVSATVSTEHTSSQEFEKAVDTKSKSTKLLKHKIPDGYIGLKCAKVTVYNETDGFKWLFPTTEPQFLTIPVDSDLIGDVYDLTAGLTTQLPQLQSRVTEKNGFTFISAHSGSISLQPGLVAELMVFLTLLFALFNKH